MAVRNFSRFAIISTFLMGSVACFADSQGVHYGVGPDIGVYFPSGSRIRSVFGSSVVGFGLHLGGSGLQDSNGFGMDFGAISANRNGSHFYVLQFMGKFELYGKRVDNVLPYAEISAGLAYANYSINYNSQNYSGTPLLPTTKLEAGALFGKDFKISAEYDLLGSTKGFNFSGFTLTATYIAYRF